MQKPELGFALIPRKPTVNEIVEYVKALGEKYPEAPVLIGMNQRPNENMETLRKLPNVALLTSPQKLGVVAFGYCLMAQARAMEIENLYFNMGIWRYDIETLADFEVQSRKYRNLGAKVHLVMGVPPILRPEHFNETEIIALRHSAVRKRLLVDLFLNYAFTTALYMDFTNINAGMFYAKKEAIKHLLSIGEYDDSSLLCPQMFWHLKRSDNNYTIRSLPVKKIELGSLGFNEDKAINEIKFVCLERQKVGEWKLPRILAANFFSEKAFWNRWFDRSRDEIWFFEVLIPKVNKLLGIKS